MLALQQLQYLLTTDNNHAVAFSHNQQWSIIDFQRDLAHCINSLSETVLDSHPSPHSFLLFADNSYHFAVNFIALNLLQKNIILTANPKPEWLKTIAHSFDAAIIEQNDDFFIDDKFSVNSLISANHYQNHSQPITTSKQVMVPKEFTNKVQFYTSGSSSEPKAINKSLTQLLLEVDVLERIFGHSLKHCRYVASVSHHHIYGLIFRLLWPLLYQHPFNTEILLYPEQLIDLSKNNPKINLISSPAFLSRQDHSLSSIQLTQCFSSGSLLSLQAAQLSAQQLGLFPTEVYGSTETGGIGYRNQDNHNDLWTLFPDTTIDIVDHGRAELHSSYLTQPQLLDDNIELLSDTQFRLLGRLDRVVKIEEKRVSLEAIEKALIASQYVSLAKVVLLEQHRTYVGGVIILSPLGKKVLTEQGKHTLNQYLKAHLSTKLEAVAIPRKWRYLDQLPYNAQGKLPLDSLTTLF